MSKTLPNSLSVASRSKKGYHELALDHAYGCADERGCCQNCSTVLTDWRQLYMPQPLSNLPAHSHVLLQPSRLLTDWQLLPLTVPRGHRTGNTAPQDRVWALKPGLCALEAGQDTRAAGLGCNILATHSRLCACTYWATRLPSESMSVWLCAAGSSHAQAREARGGLETVLVRYDRTHARNPSLTPSCLEIIIVHDMNQSIRVQLFPWSKVPMTEGQPQLGPSFFCQPYIHRSAWLQVKRSPLLT